MERYLKGALSANAASLGFHWVYDGEYIEAIANQEPILWVPQQKKHYKAAKEAYLGYEGLPVGSVTMQGSVMIWLYKALKNNPALSREDYGELLYEKMRPGGIYRGYVESYANTLIAQKIAQRFKVHMSPFERHDDHLVGMVPYLVTKEHGLSSEKAWDLAQLFTDDTDYIAFYEMLDTVFETIHSHGIKKAIEAAIKKAPEHLRHVFEAGLNTRDTKAFASTYDLVACSVHKTLPIALHICYHAQSFKQALEDNMRIGGNLSDRAAYIGAILSQIYPVDDAWYQPVMKVYG